MCDQQVWFYEHTNLYAHADKKCMPRIASWVNLYIGRKYDATVLISSVKDNQVHCIVSSFVVTYVLCLVLMVMVVFDCADGSIPRSSGREERRADSACFLCTDELQAYMDDTQVCSQRIHMLMLWLPMFEAQIRSAGGHIRI